ncbi:MAG: hypothetical protein JW795_05330, partial [Chitinivibrionales bacterium]|nr:hypothetical protein [Chitinivibrionales bacterium]
RNSRCCIQQFLLEDRLSRNRQCSPENLNAFENPNLSDSQYTGLCIGKESIIVGIVCVVFKVLAHLFQS